MSWIKNIAVVALSSACTLTLVELVFRQLELGYGNSPLEQSPKYHHIHPKNYSFRMHDPNGEYGGHMVFYDAFGLRTINATDDVDRTRLRSDAIIFLGDSFTEANQVNYEQSFVYLTGKEFSRPVLNFGVSSYSPLIYLIQAQHQLPSFAGSTVIIQLFSNDFYDDAAYERLAIYENGIIQGIDGGDPNWITKFLRQSYLLRFLRKAQLTIQTSLSRKSPISKDIGETSFVFEQSIEPAAIDASVNVLKTIQSILDRQHKKMLVIMIPSKYLTKRNSCCNDDALYKTVKDKLRQSGITFIDVAEEFEQSVDQTKLFFGNDIHLTVAGHEAITNAIVKHEYFTRQTQ